MNRNNIKWLVPFIFLFIIGCFYIVVRQSLPLAHHFFGASPDKCNDALGIASSFGDSAGFINALFSALAFGGVIITFYWQFMVDGKHQKVSLQSQFENVFFNMTDTLQQIIADLSVISADHTDIGPELSHYYSSDGNVPNSGQVNQQPPVKGRDVFKVWFQLFKRKATDSNDKIHVFEELMFGSLDHYFRYLYRILLYIDQSELINEEQKYEYAAILRAQLSEYELLILFFNGLTNHGKQKAKPLFEKYSLFNNIRRSEFVGIGSIYDYRTDINQPRNARKYSASAFDHDYEQGSSFIGFLFKVLFNTACIATLYMLIHEQWNQYIVGQLLSSVSQNNMSLTLLCVLITVYVIIFKWSDKCRLNKIMLQKRYGCLDTGASPRAIPLCSLLDREFNLVAATAICSIICITTYSNGDWHWTGSSLLSIPYIYILCCCAFADILSCLPHLRWSVVNREELLNQLSTILVPNVNSFNQWWNGMKERYIRYIADRNNGDNSTVAPDHTSEASPNSSEQTPTDAGNNTAPNDNAEDTPEDIEDQTSEQTEQTQQTNQTPQGEEVIEEPIQDAPDDEEQH